MIPGVKDDYISDHTGITAFGCGCAGKKIAQVPGVTSMGQRVTVYEVIKDGNSVAEFSSLPEARAKAIELGGRIKVGSKVLTA